MDTESEDLGTRISASLPPNSVADLEAVKTHYRANTSEAVRISLAYMARFIGGVKPHETH